VPTPRRAEPSIPTTIRLPQSLYYELRVLVCDPRTGLPPPGKWGRAFESAIRDWLDKQKTRTV
jgi:hypothetical protein